MRRQESQSGRMFCAKGVGRASQSPVELLDFASSGFCVFMPGRVNTTEAHTEVINQCVTICYSS
jgi:hypothetical protein